MKVKGRKKLMFFQVDRKMNEVLTFTAKLQEKTTVALKAVML
jgi:hypothetical protein